MQRISTDSGEYVVFDIETNGLSSHRDDLLSISFYKPDDGKEYNKFLPLELNKKIMTTHINGITESDLADATPLNQIEFDYIVKEFELDTRKILVYSGRNFDASFLAAYMRRHNIKGFETLQFYNFKKNIISSRFSTGNITKDNLCSIFNIEGVETVHTGSNDCKLEWKLFEKMGGYYYLVTEGDGEDNVFRLNDDYIIPASLFASHPNLGKLLGDRPYIDCKSTLVKKFEIPADGIEKFPTNFTGMTIEHLINSMLCVENQDNRIFLLGNKMKLDFVGKIPNGIKTVPMFFNSDGTVSAVNAKDKKVEERLNSTAENLKARIEPLVKYIKKEIFNDNKIKSQELVINHDNNILALCDLSAENAILEIKTDRTDSSVYKEQLYYQAKGRKVYHLSMEWVKDWKTDTLQKVIFLFFSVDVYARTYSVSECVNAKQDENKAERVAVIESHLQSTDISLLAFLNSDSMAIIKCKKCEHEWSIKYSTLIRHIPKCPICNEARSMTNRKSRSTMTKKELEESRANSFYTKVYNKSEQKIEASNYVGARYNVDATCRECGYRWSTRSDHLLARCWCPQCKKN